MRYAPSVGLLALLMIITSCTQGGGGDAATPSGSVSPPISASPSASPSRTGPLTTGPGVKPGETPPRLDGRGQNHDDEGALFFAQYFVQTVDWSVATTDPNLIGRLSAPSCTTCNAYIAKLKDLADVGGFLTGGRITITSESVVTGTSKFKSDKIVAFMVTQEPSVTHRPNAVPSTDAPTSSSYPLRVYLNWVGAWTTAEVGTT